MPYYYLLAVSGIPHKTNKIGLGDLYKTRNKNIMQNQEKLDTIAVLSASIDSFNRAGITNEIDVLVKKILELVKQL